MIANEAGHLEKCPALSVPAAMPAGEMTVLLALSGSRRRALAEAQLRGKVRRVLTAGSVQETLSALSGCETDVLMADCALPGGDAELMIRKICDARMNSYPIAILLLPQGLANYRVSLYNGRVREIHSQPEDGNLSRALNGLSPGQRLLPCFADRPRIEDCLDRLSIEPRLKGYAYLIDAIALVARDTRLIRSLGGVVYPEVAAAHHTGSAPVERAIRHAIECAFVRGSLEEQYRLFGNSISEEKGKPTNAEFISRVVETLRLEA